MNILAFAFFVFLSAIFWFSIAVNKKYIETISLPIKYENFPPRRVQLGDLPDKLRLTVEASGFIIIQHKIWSTIDPINIDLSKSSIFPISRRDTSKFFVLTNLERKQISSQLASEIRIMDINPDTIMFHFDYLKIKKVPVIAEIEVNCEKQYMLVGKPYLDPDSVVISGPSTVLDTLQALHTKKIVLNNVTEPIDKNLSIEKVRGTDAEKRKLRLIADVDKYTETRIEIPVIQKNVPDSLQLKTFPKIVHISYLVPFKIFETISAEDFQITVDYNKIANATQDKLKLNLEKVPENIKVLGWEPKNVEFIIEK